MCKLYSVEAYNYVCDCWEHIGEFISDEEAVKIVNYLEQRYSEKQFSVFEKEIYGTFENFIQIYEIK